MVVALIWPDSRSSRELETQEQFAPPNEDLRERCCKLSAELSELIERWQNAVDAALQLGMIAQAQREGIGDPDGSLEIRSHDIWLVKEYGEKFGGKVLRLSDDLAQHGCITPETRKRLESPEKPQDVQYIAHRLKVICNNSNFDPQENSAQQNRKESVMPDQRTAQESEEPRGYVDNRSVPSHNQTGGYTGFFNIFNQGGAAERGQSGGG
jgi:hypothetical protein